MTPRHRGDSRPAKISGEVVSEFTRRTSVDRLYAIAQDQVVRTWGNGCALRLGPVLYRALLSDELLRMAAAQAAAGQAAPETVSFMVARFRDLLAERHPYA